jgi:hypothetical protein
MKSIDWNDLLVSAGLDEVRRQIEAGLEREPVSGGGSGEDWKSYLLQIEAVGDDLDRLIVISNAVNSASLHPAVKHRLLKSIAKAGGVSVDSLRSSGSGGAGRDQDNSSDWLDELNNRHAIVPVSGKVLIMNQEYDPALDRNLVTFSSRQDFLL